MKHKQINTIRMMLFFLIILFFGLLSASTTHAETFTLVKQWGSTGDGEGQFRSPYYIAVDSSNNVYVTDNDNRIQKFDSNGNFLKSWGSYGNGNGQLIGPQGIAVDSSGNVFVVDGGNNRIEKFDSNGKYLLQWGSKLEVLGGSAGKFNSPLDVAVDSLGNVYVSDSNSCIQKFDNNGKFITKWGYPEFGFGYPFDVAVDPSNNIYVTDYTYNHVWKFDNNGNFLKSWGGFGSKNGVFKGLYGITIDSSGDVYALEGLNVYETGLDNRVQIFTGDGTYINQWKYPGCGHSIAVDSAGNFYIPDSDHNCIEKFAISPFPSGIDIKPVNLEKDTPSVYMDEPITFSYHTDTVAGVDINIHIEETGQDISGKMAGGPTDWTYTTTFSQCYGKATVTYTMSGQQPIVFDIYIDPAGYIYDTDTGQRIEDAFVWLQIPDGNGGWANVTTGKGIMTPDTNPLSTDQNGVYQWDVIPGIYRVHVEANGYEPADSMSVNVQQPITDLNVGLHRNSNGTSVPEFPSIAIPVAAILGLIAINGRRKN